MLNNPDNKYHLTITFRQGTSDRAAHQALNECIGRFNQRAYGRRYIKQRKRIHGFAVRERTANETVHFHMIIRDPYNDLELKRSFEETVESVIPAIRNPFYSDTKRLIGDNGKKVQKYYNDGSSGLEQYLTKNFDKHSLSLQEKIDTFGVLDYRQVWFGDTPF